MARLNANLANYESQDGFDCLPPGWYQATVIDSEIKDGPKGPYINWTWQIEGKSNRVWDVMSLANDVSMQRLKTMATCCGHKNPNYIADTEELHGMRCNIRLKVESDPDGRYENKNKITAFKKAEGTGTAGTVPKMPWE